MEQAMEQKINTATAARLNGVSPKTIIRLIIPIDHCMLSSSYRLLFISSNID